ncbi:MAG: PepSY domain-containing protein [Dehalococcoidia bacterium]|jgi:uncharacterized membrane protein YkoI
MITRDEAIEIARKEAGSSVGPDSTVRVKLKDDRYVVEFKLVWPPGTRGPDFVRITIDARSGEVLERLMDA